MNSPLSPQRDTNSPVDCLRGCGRIRARLPHRALWTVPRQNSPRKNSQRANQQSHSRIFLKIFPRPSTKICQEHFQMLYITPFQIKAALPVQAAAAVAQNSNFFIGQHNAYPPPILFREVAVFNPACPFVLSNRSYSAQRLQWQLPGPR